jgi:integrase
MGARNNSGVELHKVKVRDGLEARREPYWAAPLARGQHVGLRKLDDGTSTWIARYRDDDGHRHYKALGLVRPEFDYDSAADAARQWIKLVREGVKTHDVVTVSDACRAYVAERRTAKSEACAHDADKRFERTVYEAPFGRQALTKLRAAKVRAWRDGLELLPASANRTLTALKAALNLAVHEHHAPAELAVDLRRVKPLPGGNKRRGLYLDLRQRRALLAATRGAMRDLLHAAMLTGARAGELVGAHVSQFDAHTKSMRFAGKTGTRTVPLSTPAVALFKRRAKGRAPTDLLLTRDDGQPWAHSDWDELIRAAAKEAGLPADPGAGTCLYTLRHSFITEALTNGLSTLEVARLVGTSLPMIEKHYGHLVASAARQRLAKVTMV